MVEQLKETLPEQGHNTVEYREEYSDTEKEMDEPSGWLLSHDIMEIIGYCVGFSLFLAIFSLIVYLKCRTKAAHTTTFLPLFDNLQQSVQMRGGEGRFESFRQPSGYSPVTQPQPEDHDSCHQMVVDESTTAVLQSPPQTSEPGPSLQHHKKTNLNPQSQSQPKDPPSLISSVIRTA